MSETTKISWAHHTASPWYGCTEVSAGCANCYAREWGKKLKVEWGKGKPRVQSKSFEANARKWNRAVEPFKNWSNHERPRIFPSLCDWLDPEVPAEWLADFLRVIYETPNLNWLLLTKRPELFDSRMLEVYFCNSHIGQTARELANGWRISCSIPRNVWFGFTAEDGEHWEERSEIARDIPAKVLWCSFEPLLEPIDLDPERLEMLNWAVVGGESGPKRRDCGVDAIVDVAQQCVSAGVPVWVKQASALKPGQQGRIPDEIWKLKQLPGRLA